MSKYFDRIIVSADEGFLDFWPTVSTAWQLHFGIKPTLALVTHEKLPEKMIEKAKTYGEIVEFKAVPNIPIQNQAKIARFLAATKYPNEICTIEDIDTIPLQSEFVNEKLSKRLPGKILAVGKEVYDNSEHEGKFPISQLTSEGENFAKLFNPQNLPYEDVILSFANIGVFDHKEKLLNRPDTFSDESLIRALVFINRMSDKMQFIERGVDAKRQWIDRSWWGIDSEKLFRGEYIICNFLRPFKQNFHLFDKILLYTYKRHVTLEEVTLT